METIKNKIIIIDTTVKAPIEKTWSNFTDPKDITRWCNASDDWHAPYAENDLKVNGKFKTTMAAKDGSAKFDFEGVYTKVEKHKEIDYTMGDGRKVKIVFSKHSTGTKVIESFEPESENSLELQKDGWQSILNNFKKYTESKK
jgi:uncharacterized protein YndB with AHSA1/START domain